VSTAASQIQVQVRNEDLLSFEGDGIMLPTISSGRMILPIAAAAKKLVGEEIEAEVIGHAPIAVGACLVTEAGPLKARHLIHAPAIEEPGMRIGVENIRRAVRASLLGAVHYELSQVALPGFGYDEGGVSHEETARAIIDEIAGFKHPFPQVVVLMDRDLDMFEAFEMLASSR
jgi:O-acetyl-ADP-ribose deacetylase (regulator of RNase III)